MKMWEMQDRNEDILVIDPGGEGMYISCGVSAGI